MSDTTDLTAAGPGTAIAVQGSRDMLAMIAEAARDPTVDAQKMVTLADLAIKLRGLEKEEQFRKDKASAIMAMPVIRKDGKIVIPGKGTDPDRVQGRFAKWESLQAVIDPILASFSLVISHETDAGPNGLLVRPILTHLNGYEERGGAMPLPLDTSGGKNNVQGAGSSLSYGMRYTAVAMLHIKIQGVDDDGNGTESGAEREDRFNPEQRALIDEARSQAMRGVAAYTAWFGALNTAAKGWLVYEGFHAELKTAAENAKR